MTIISRLCVCTSLVLGCLASDCVAQVVQLPSITTFSYSGSVLVPDSGSAYLGGRGSAAMSTRSRLASRSMSSQLGTSGASVHATIIDLNAMDRAILGVDPKQLRAGGSPTLPSVNSIASRMEEGKQLVRFARAQFRSGNTGAAFDAYRMAIEILPGELRELATSEFRRVFPVASIQVANAGSRRAD